MIKIYFFTTVCLLLIQNTYATTNKSVWLYGGLSFGTSHMESDVDDEGGQKDGSQYGLLASGLYNTDNWAVNTSLNWFEVNFDSEYEDNTKVELKTRTFTAEISPLWKPHHRWYIGPKAATTISDEIIFGPGSGNTTNSLVGLNTFYEIPWKKRKIRAGIHYNKLLDTPDRSAHTILLSLEVGMLLIQDNKNVNVSKERFQEKAANKIDLNEQIINFETGSSKLTEKSRKFLNGLGSALRDIRNDWEILNIQGHTDVRGSKQYNQDLSERRVQSVIAALVEGGAPQDRIDGKAYGETRPVSLESTKEAHALNRRVELHFIGETNKEKIKKILDELLSSIF